jgi:hypothetical protein
MSTPTTADDLGPHSVMGDALEHRPRPTPVRVARRSDMLAYLLLVSLTLAVWQFTRLGLYTAQSDTGYWMGVVGGVLMLLLFAYPLRKRWAWLAGKGKAKHWFVVHMVLGIFGPLLVLAHSTFQIGSVNAGVALFSMLIVSASGVAGRFIYLRIHRGLGGEKLTLEALRQTLGFTANSVRSQLHFAPLAEARLRALDVHAGAPGDRWVDHLQRLLVLPWHVRRERRLCQREVDRALRGVADQQNWGSATLRARRVRARRLVADYTTAVLRVAQLAAYTRMFSLWHVLHVPFVFLMVLCAIAHIVAVHAY